MKSKKTPLYRNHIELNAKMVDFAGYQMPIQYKGIKEEHNHVRSSAGLFDVSHMGEIIVSGNNAEDFLDRMLINDVKKIQTWDAQYSAMCNEDGGIIDDLIVYRYPEHYMLVVNASNIQKNLQELGLTLNESELKKVTQRVIELGDRKERVTAEDLPFIISDVLGNNIPSKVKINS